MNSQRERHFGPPLVAARVTEADGRLAADDSGGAAIGESPDVISDQE